MDFFGTFLELCHTYTQFFFFSPAGLLVARKKRKSQNVSDHLTLLLLISVSTSSASSVSLSFSVHLHSCLLQQ